MSRVKVCGLTRPTDVDAAVDAGADALGFVVDVSVDSPREVTASRAADLVARVPPLVTTVLVTMAAPDEADALAGRVGADAVQLHGDPGPSAVAAVDRPCLMAVDAAAPETARRYADAADALVVDSTDDAGAGGTGRTHDWSATRELAADLPVPVVLAGGLTPANVADAVDAAEPYAVDVATGVEARGGEKDHDAVAAFVARAGRAGT